MVAGSRNLPGKPADSAAFTASCESSPVWALRAAAKVSGPTRSKVTVYAINPMKTKLNRIHRVVVVAFEPLETMTTKIKYWTTAVDAGREDGELR